MRDEIRKHLIQPICFHLGRDKPHWSGSENEEGHWQAWEDIFGEMTPNQLDYLQKYYKKKVYPQIRKEIERSKRVYFPSPADMQSYLAEIKDEKKDKEHVKFLEERKEEEERKIREEIIKEKELIHKNQKANHEAFKFLQGKDEKKVQYAARVFRFETNGWPKEGIMWDVSKNWKAEDTVTEIIKSGKLEEFKETL